MTSKGQKTKETEACRQQWDVTLVQLGALSPVMKSPTSGQRTQQVT